MGVDVSNSSTKRRSSSSTSSISGAQANSTKNATDTLSISNSNNISSNTTSNKRLSDQMIWLAHMESTTTAVRKVETRHDKDKFINDLTNFFHRGRYGLDFDVMAQSWNSEVLEQERADIPDGNHLKLLIWQQYLYHALTLHYILK